LSGREEGVFSRNSCESAQQKKTPIAEGDGRFGGGGQLGRNADRLELAASSLASDAMDVRAVDAEVVQFAVGHAAEFSNGLTILAPVVERACQVRGSRASAPSIFGAS